MSIRKKSVSYMLCLAMTILFMPHSIYATNNEKIKTGMAVSKSNTQSTTSDIIGIDVPTKFSSPGYEVVFKVNNQWDGAFNGEFILKNTSNEPIENWSIAFNFDHEITNIWNAKIVSHDNGKYILKNVEYNQDILPGNSVSIGFQANYKDLIVAPASYNLLATSQEAVASDYKIDFKVTSDWGQAFNGEISITNKSEQVIEDWTLEFDFDRKISSFWTADIEKHEGNHYVIKNKGYNANIKVGETLVLGFAGAPGNVDNEPENYVLCQKNVKEEIDYEKDTDNDGLPDYLEKEIGTDPKNADSDADGLPDGYEYFNLGTDPTIADSDNNGISDADEDFDDDKLTNFEEYKLGTEPYCEDTDGDYLSDYEEVNAYKTNPLVADTDGDGICDGDEVKIGLDPLNKCTYGVPDSEYKVEQTIESDAINYNKTEDKYQVSLDVTASGCVENNLIVDKSSYSNIISANDAVLGNVLEVAYNEGEVSKATLSFKLSDTAIKQIEELDLHHEALSGIKRYNVFRYFEDDNLLLPIVTTFDENSNTVKADVELYGTYCIMDLDTIMTDWGIWDEEQNIVSDRQDMNTNLNRCIPFNDIRGNSIYFNKSISNSSILEREDIFSDPITKINLNKASGTSKSTLIPDWVTVYLVDNEGKERGNQYALMDPANGKTWNEAKKVCESLGGHLVTINSLEEQKYITEKLLPKGTKYMYWIGGIKNDNEWKWETGDKAFKDYQNWADNSSKNSGSYLQMYRATKNGNVAGTWRGENKTGGSNLGENKYWLKNCGYICEWDYKGKDFGYIAKDNFTAGTNLKKFTLKGNLERFGDTNSDLDSRTDSQEVNWSLMDEDGSLPSIRKLIHEKHDGYVESGMLELNVILSQFKADDKARQNFLNSEILPLISDPLKEDSDGDGYNDDKEPYPLVYNDYLYNGELAAEYARIWSWPQENGKACNPIYERFDNVVDQAGRIHTPIPHWGSIGGDCANYVSQCLEFGNIPMNDSWYYYKKDYGRDMTASWASANSQFKYFSGDSHYCDRIITISNISALSQYVKDYGVQVGDLLYWDWESDGTVDHATIITKVEGGKIYYSGHTNDRVDQSVEGAFEEKNTLKIVTIKYTTKVRKRGN